MKKCTEKTRTCPESWKLAKNQRLNKTEIAKLAEKVRMGCPNCPAPEAIMAGIRLQVEIASSIPYKPLLQ